MRRAFHHLVRKKKALYWHSWLQAQERASAACPQLAARNIRRQFGPSRRPLPANMRSSSPHGGTVEGAACIDAWRCHFRDVPVSAGSVSASSPDLESDVRRLRRQMYATASRFDFPFSEPELLQVLQQLPANRAPGPDGLTYELYRIDDGTMRNALLSFFELVRCWAVVPSVWRSAVVTPLHKTGAEDEFTNYRPISLLCCGLKVFERLLLTRLLPHVNPRIDESQAGFRWGAEEQIYTLVETLRLRARKRTFCAFVDVRKAFDVAWRDAVRVQLAALGVTGSTWRVLDDLLGATSARVLVHGTLSEPWDERAGVRQGSVLGPLLFNILFDGISAAVRAACPGVPLGRGPRAPRVTLLLYADDLVVLADSESGLQRALDAIGAWGARWRFSFGIGPDKTAVLAVGCRSRDFRFVLQGSAVPVVPEYRYLGVIFQASKRWNKQTDRLISKSTRKFHQCIAWAESRGLHTSFRRSLFQSYVLPSMTHGAAFLDDTSVRRLDKHVRQLGRRLLCWPAGTPNAAVLGELGWDPFAVQVLRGQASLLGRLSSATPGGMHRGLAARVFRYAVGVPSSWAAGASRALNSAGVTLPHEFGLGPGSNLRVLQRWRHRCVRPVLDRVGWRARQVEASELASLATFIQCHPDLDFSQNVHASRLPSSAVREWTLARCGHHPF